MPTEWRKTTGWRFIQSVDSLTRRHADSGLFHIGDMQIDDTIGTENSSDMQVTENSRDMQFDTFT